MLMEVMELNGGEWRLRLMEVNEPWKSVTAFKLYIRTNLVANFAFKG